MVALSTAVADNHASFVSLLFIPLLFAMPYPNEDPIVTSSRREALLTVLIWCATLTYSVGYCYTYGYNRPLDSSLSEMTFYFGWPDWVFWGILVPWTACTVVSALFAFVIMKDAPLGEDRDDEEELL